MKSGLVHESSVNKTHEWYTPPEVFEALDTTFDLDPCSPNPPLDWVPAEYFFCKADDGLAQDWFGRVWMNPPYGKETPQWMKKLADHGDGIALVFARTDTRWFHEHVMRSTLVCFMEGRIRFINELRERGGYSGLWVNARGLWRRVRRDRARKRAWGDVPRMCLT